MPTSTQLATREFVRACGGAVHPDALDMTLHAANGTLRNGQGDETDEEEEEE